MFYVFQYRINPTTEQEVALDFLLWQGRKVWNEALEQRITQYKEKQKTLRAPDQWPYFRDLRRSEPEVLGKLNATVMNRILRRLDKAFDAFFRRLKSKKEKPGFPHFKNRQTFTSLEFVYGNGCKIHYLADHKPWLYIMNVGIIKLVYHRPIPPEGTLKAVVVRRHANKWNISIMVQLPDVEVQRVETGFQVGIDVGLHSLLVYSDGTMIENPRWLQENLAQLRILNRKAARQLQGSNRQKQTYREIAKLHHRIACRRKDFWHKITRHIVTTYDTIAIENLRQAFMHQNKYMARSAHDAALGMFKPLLTYKAKETGARLIAVNPRNTSQLCSNCGTFVKKGLDVRVHKCPNCGIELDRDINAARNILNLA